MGEKYIFQSSSIQSSTGVDLSKDYDYSDAMAQYINDMIVQEEMFQEAEKSYYQVLQPDLQVPNPSLGIFDSDKNYFAGESSSNPNLGIFGTGENYFAGGSSSNPNLWTLGSGENYFAGESSSNPNLGTLGSSENYFAGESSSNPNVGTLGSCENHFAGESSSNPNPGRFDENHFAGESSSNPNLRTLGSGENNIAGESSFNPNLGTLGSGENNFAGESSSNPNLVLLDESYLASASNYTRDLRTLGENYFADKSSHTDPIEQDCVALHNSSVDVASTINSQLPHNAEVMNSSEITQHSLKQYQIGVEISKKFLHDSSLVGLRDDYSSCVKDLDSLNDETGGYYGLKGKRNLRDREEHRRNKKAATYKESIVRSAKFDEVLLNDNISTYIGNQSKGPNGKKSRGKKKQKGKRNAIEWRSLLMKCAKAVAVGDCRTANEYLMQIRQYSSPKGDGMERLAHYFAVGLEGRMFGYGERFYQKIISFPESALVLLKTYQSYLLNCPYWNISVSFSNKTIWNAAENAQRLHIVDFGILFGFQFPALIRRLSFRPGGPPKLHITGIDSPDPGMRPARRVEETGLRLADYAKSFNVPFEFHAIAKQWETIKMDDLNIREDEVLIVNCLYRLRSLLDETVVINSPRNTVINLIKKMNPHTYIMGVVNGPCNAPIFITRFKEALSHYSSFFDMLEANFPRDSKERRMLEKKFYAKEAMNVIGCEGTERVERPETYKKWQVNNHVSGFEQLPLNQEIVDTSIESLKAYRKEFLVGVDKNWLLQGWKGRIVYALSSWRLR